MPVRSIKIMNVLAFQDQFTLTFSDGINVIIGGNGTGKTTLLKMIYTAAQWSAKPVRPGKNKSFHQYFSHALSDASLTNHDKNTRTHSAFAVSDGKHTLTYCLAPQERVDAQDWINLNISSVFIPTTEMLSHAKGFLALNEKYDMPFDDTQIDILINASLPEARVCPPYSAAILKELSNVIDGEVIFEHDIFYVVKKDGRKIDFALEAEGLRKLALLWKLIRNGLLEQGAILLWDEPEANLNPELFPLVAKILLTLQENGIQIFLATHSYHFAKYLELLRTQKEQVLFHDLHKDAFPAKSDTHSSSSTIHGKSACCIEELEPNHLSNADEKLLDLVYREKVQGK